MKWRHREMTTTSLGERPRRNNPWSWTFWFPNGEKPNFYCLSHPLSGTLLWQREQTNSLTNSPLTLGHWVVVPLASWVPNTLLTVSFRATGCSLQQELSSPRNPGPTQSSNGTSLRSSLTVLPCNMVLPHPTISVFPILLSCCVLLQTLILVDCPPPKWKRRNVCVYCSLLNALSQG